MEVIKSQKVDGMRVDLLLKMMGAFGSFMSFYSALRKHVPYADIALMALISALLISLGREVSKRRAENKVRISIPVSEMEKGIIIRDGYASRG